MSFTNNFTAYLNSRYNHLSKDTIKNYKADVGMFVRWYEQKYSVTLDINPSWINIETIETYRKEKIISSNLSTRSFKRHLSSLRKFFEFLRTEGIISQDPFKTKTLLDQETNQNDKWHLRRFKNYLSLNNKSSLTIKNYVFDLQRFLTWAEHLVGENVYGKIDESLFEEYKKNLLKKGLSIRTIKRNFSSLRKYFTWASTEHIFKATLPKSFNPAKDFVKDALSRRSIIIEGYSSFPPLRLIQKAIKGTNFVLDVIIIASIVKIIETLSFSISKIKGKPVFKDVPSINHEFAIRRLSPETRLISKNTASRNAEEITNIFGHKPWHKKIQHHILHTRPKWYKIYHSYSISDYLHLSVLILSMSILGFAIYQNITPIQEKSVLSSFTAYTPRILSFKGNLTDDSGNPITQSNTPLRVAVYNDQVASGSALLWQDVIKVSPDENGAFSALIGTQSPIPQNAFSDGQPLWLGVSISNSTELIPRQPLSTVALAKDSENLQGLSPITNGGTKNVVLALDSSGDLTIGENANPTFQATGGSFRLLGETLILSTTPGADSNVEVTPMDLGKIDLQKPIFNSTNNNNVYQAIGSVEIDDSLAVLATTSAQSTITISQDSTGSLISAYTTGLEQFRLNNNGNIFSTTGAKWQPFSDSTSALNIANAAGNTFITFDTENSKLRFLQDSEERGEIFYLNSDSSFHIRSATALAFNTQNSDSTRVYIANSGNVGINTTSPAFRLDIRDSKDATATAQIFNTSTSTDADGLIVKLGNTSTTVDINNRFISFETSGIGVVGSIRGDESTGIDFKKEGIADFAEYIKKDKNQSIKYGSVICIDDNGLALPCDNAFNKIIGVSSNQGGFTGGKDQGEESIRIGFVGQVYTIVSTVNGDIKPGDPLTSSSTPGVAVKAVERGQIIGKAMQAFNPNTSECVSPNASEFGSIGTNNSDQLVCQGKILVSVNVSWYDPNFQVENLKDRILRIVKDHVQGSKIISPITKVNQFDSDIISPLTSNVHSSSTSASLEPDLDESKASTLAAQIPENSDGYSDNQISSGDQNVRNSYVTDSSDPSPDGPTIRGTEFSEFSELGLISFGPVSLSDTSITGQLSISPADAKSDLADGLKLKYNSINVLGTDLALQSLRQGGLSIMGNLIYIDTSGNLQVGGVAKFAKDVIVNGNLTVFGNGTFNKINLKLAKETITLSQKEIIATGSAGAAFVHTHEMEVTIKNSLVTEKSLIYITPVGTPSGQIPYLIRQSPEKPLLPARRSLLDPRSFGEVGSEGRSEIEGSFTVGIASKSASKIPFNWLIIN